MPQKKLFWFFNRAQLPRVLVLFFLAVFGVALLFAGSWGGKGKVVQEVKAEESFFSEEEALEKRLAEALEKIAGAGRVEVTVFFATGPEYTYVTDVNLNERKTEEKEGAKTRTITERVEEKKAVLARAAGGAEQPAVVQKKGPEIRGVLVTATGARDPKVKLALTRAVETLTGVSANQVYVFPGEEGN